MCALIVDGGGEEKPERFQNFLERLFGPSKEYEPKRLSEKVVLSLISRGCNISEIQALLILCHEYKAEYTGAQQIAYSDDFGWMEMLQYRPGVLSTAILKAQSQASLPLNPSYRAAAAYALGWPLQKVIGFQMGVCNKLIENPIGTTDDHYLNGMALGYLFFEHRQVQVARGDV